MFKRICLITMALCALLPGHAQSPAKVLSLEECRELALRNSKELQMQAQKVQKAEYQKREAFAAYLPSLDFEGAYAYNQKNMSVFGEDQLLPVKNFNPQTQSYEYALVTNPVTNQPVMGPNGQYIPQQVALIPKEALTFDIHNVFFGAVTLTQPLYMGGKITALNRLAEYNRSMNSELQQQEQQNVTTGVDAAYWTVVSLKAKRLLAESYVNLLDTLQRNVELMVREGVATLSDRLSVDVKLNQAQVDMLKVDNGLRLSKMALAQLCGLPMQEPLDVADGLQLPEGLTAETAGIDMEAVYGRRHDLRALQDAVGAMGAQKRVAMAGMLPSVALMGAYSFSNPNMFNGFEKRFNGAFSVGVMVKVPLFHWGGNYYKYKAAATEENIMKLKVQDAREKIELQVNQAVFRAQEAVKTYQATESNLEKARENLRTATLGFREGVLTAQNVMEAQTAWLKAHSENIDAKIDVKLCDVYLLRALGNL